MKCPKCGGDSKVTDSRKAHDEIYRRRACKKCGYSFYTFEAIDESENVKKLLSKIVIARKKNDPKRTDRPAAVGNRKKR